LISGIIAMILKPELGHWTDLPGWIALSIICLSVAFYVQLTATRSRKGLNVQKDELHN
jgi:hypothetical protein